MAEHSANAQIIMPRTLAVHLSRRSKQPHRICFLQVWCLRPYQFCYSTDDCMLAECGICSALGWDISTWSPSLRCAHISCER